MVNKDLDGWLYLNPKISTENTSKNAKKNDNLLKTKIILKFKYKPSGGLVFTFSLLVGQFSQWRN